MVKAEDVDWSQYFKGIRQQCPWSWQAFQQQQIDIVDWQGYIVPLGQFQARIYICDVTDQELESLADRLDSESETDEWLFSYPGYGDWATPVRVLIQQDRIRLDLLRDIINSKSNWLDQVGATHTPKKEDI